MFRKFLDSFDIPESEWEDPRLDLKNTQARVQKMDPAELLAGYIPGAYDKLVAGLTCFSCYGAAAMVLVTAIDVTSTCSDHGLCFTGVVHVACSAHQTYRGVEDSSRCGTLFAYVSDTGASCAADIRFYL